MGLFLPLVPYFLGHLLTCTTTSIEYLISILGMEPKQARSLILG